MSHPEQDQKKSSEFKLVLPSQQTPYSGVFEEVYTDYLNDPEKFTVIMIHNMEEDNPNFVGLFNASTVFSPLPDLTIKWISVYYEIFAKSNRIRGLPPVYLTDKLVDEDFRLFKLKFESIMGGNNQVALSIQEKEKERRRRDEALSPELVLFWQSVDRDMEDEIANGTDEVDLLRSNAPLINLQEFLQKQDDEYAITQAYASK